MIFFKSIKEVETSDLKLSEYDNIWSKFCFLDETGSLSDKTNPYFTLGLMKMSQPYYLQNKILYERSKQNFYDEMKFNKLSKNNINFAKFVVESIFDTKSINFYSYTIDKRGTYFNKAFDGNEWIAYEEITLKLLEVSLSKQEILILIADHITTPKGIKFEVNTKRNFNQKNKRLALAGVCRFDSKSNDLLQVIDLIIGAITYDIKLTEGIVSGSKYKIELVDFLKSKLGVTSFSSGFKNHSFNVFVDQTKGEK